MSLYCRGMPTLADPLPLPCGLTLKNRIVKSAMSENLGTPAHAPSNGIETLYRRWAAGGLGLQVTGNVMVDGRALGEPGNIVLEDERDLPSFQRWASAATENGTRCFMQLNHPGKQSPTFLSKQTVAPSAVGFGETLEKMFATPRALRPDEITDLIARFGNSAALAKEAGFSGVQIHGAHGYLVSQFLSPRHNIRDDEWGGSQENRARFLREVYLAIRAAVGPEFPVAIKMNSADFQKGGFSEDDSIEVMRWLEDNGIDFIEVSGGTYEAPAMMAGDRKKSTVQREGYFLDFVAKATRELSVPVCITGGFRSPRGMQHALDEGAAMVGLARTLCVQPGFAGQVLAGEDVMSQVEKKSTGIKLIDGMGMLDVLWYEDQLALLASGREPVLKMSAARSLLRTVMRGGWQSLRMRRAK